MAFQSDPIPQERQSGTSDDLADAMVTKGPVPDSDLVAVNPDARAFANVRIALIVEAILLAALGVWGLIAALTVTDSGPSGPPVLLFHITWQHAILLLATALLALGGTAGHSWALRFTTLQAVGYGILFIVGAGQRNWFADPADDVLHACLAIIGLALFMWTAARAMNDNLWLRRRTGRSDAR